LRSAAGFSVGWSDGFARIATISRIYKLEDFEMTGAEIITAERQRQVEEEGWTPEHDDKWGEGELVNAAVCYAQFAYWGCVCNGEVRNMIRREWKPGYVHIRGEHWPFDASWWKPACGNDINGRILELAKAGALIAAEIDRLKRQEQRGL
jgi:hypothetical protein